MEKEPFFKIVFHHASIKAEAKWETYTKTYGSWMTNAFLYPKKGKEKFLYALDFLHKNCPQSAVQILDTELKTLCKTSEEKTTWLFFMGVAHEAMEQYAKAFLYFISASEYEQKSSVIHHKLADCAYREGLFGVAEYHYQEAIHFLKKDNTSDLSTLAVLYSSLASCFIMMHKYEDAKEALLYAEKTAIKTPTQKVRALLYTVLGEYEKAESALTTFLKQNNISENFDLQQQMDSLRSKKNEQFYTIYVENSEINDFWKWFSDRLDRYLAILDTNQANKISKMTAEISSRLKKVFPFIQRTIHVYAYKNETYAIFVSDGYAKALSDGLTNLFTEIPKNIKEKIHWIIIR